MTDYSASVQPENTPILPTKAISRFAIPYINNGEMQNFLQTTYDQWFLAEKSEKLSGFIGRREMGFDPLTDVYVKEPTKSRQDYQLEPFAISQQPDQTINATRSYPALVEHLKSQGAFTNNNDKLFSSEYYAWCPPVDVDTLINFNNYYWLTYGPTTRTITASTNANAIIGDVTYTITNYNGLGDDLVFESGMRIRFTADIDTSFNNVSFIVENVGIAIMLINDSEYDDPRGYDNTSYDTRMYDSGLTNADEPDFIVMQRGSRDGNPWSTRNRWFHRDSITDFNVDSYSVLQAKRPIIEFNRNIELVNYGRVAREPVDLISTDDNMADIIGQGSYSIDGFALADDMRILITGDTNELQNNRVYRVLGLALTGQIALILETDGEAGTGAPTTGETIRVISGVEFADDVFWYDGSAWILTQEKTSINQQPLFELYDTDGVSLADSGTYPDSDFVGNKIFGFKTDPDVNPDSVITNLRIVYDGSGFGGIVFDDFLETDRVTYTQNSSRVEIDGLYFFKNLGEIEADDTFADDWNKPSWESRQYVVDAFTIYKQVTLQGVEYFNRTYEISQAPDANLPTAFPTRKVILNTTELIEGTEYTISGTTVNLSLNLILADKDYLQIKTYNAQNDDVVDGFYEIPYNLQANPNNAPIESLTFSQLFDQFASIIKNQYGATTGSGFGNTNYRNTARDVTRGTFIIQNSAPMLKMMYHTTADASFNYDILESTIFAENNYSIFQAKIRRQIQNLYLQNYTSLTPVDDWITAILAAINLGKTVDFPFYNTMMMGIHSYMPSTPAANGILPVYRPEIYLDTTLRTPRNVLKGHDGSLTEVYDDFRDDIILAIENEIYDNLPSKFKGDVMQSFELLQTKPGRFRTTRFTLNQWTTLLSSAFQRWVTEHKANYKTNETTDGSDPFTWNFSGVMSNDGIALPGSWRAIYEYYFDTDRPHLCPWEMLGFGEIPDWWETEYGAAPYTGGNIVMWNDIESGTIRGGEFAGTYSYLTRSGISNFIPVDAEGNLLDPVSIGLVNPVSYATAKRDWSFGEIGPAELAWRRSWRFSFAVAEAAYLAAPAKFVELGWEPEALKRIFIGQANSQIIYIPENRRKASDEFEIYMEELSDGSLVYRRGLQQWVADFLISQSRNITTYYAERIRDLIPKLGYRLGGFAQKDSMRFYADNFGLVPSEDTTVILSKSSTVRQYVYSGMVIEWSGKNFIVYGYDLLRPFFSTIPSDKARQKIGKTIGHSQVTEYKFGMNSVVDVPYGIEFDSIQKVYDFIISYGRWLKSENWVFEYIDVNQELMTWSTLADKFVNWTQTTGLQVSDVIILSPAAFEAKLDNVFGFIEPIRHLVNGVYSILDAGGYPIDTRYVNVSRSQESITITTTNSQTIYCLRLQQTEYEHAYLFENITKFNDLIYDPVLNLRQSRFKIIGYRSADWTGRFEAPGLIINESAATANFEKTTDDIAKFYDRDFPSNTSSQDELAKHLTGFQEKSYLVDLEMDRQSQYDFYLGSLDNKGTKEALNKIVRNRILSPGDSAPRFAEEWAFMIGEYGATEFQKSIELTLPQDQFKTNPQTVYFTTGDVDSDSDTIISITPDDSRWVKKNGDNNQDRFSLLPLGYNTGFYRTAGPLRIGDADYYVKNMDELALLTDLEDGDLIWVADYNGSWMLFKVVFVGTTTASHVSGSTITLDSNNLPMPIIEQIYVDGEANRVYTLVTQPSQVAFPGALVYRRTDYSVAGPLGLNWTFGSIPFQDFNAYGYNFDGSWNAVTPTRLTVPEGYTFARVTAGWYSFTITTTPGAYRGQFKKNGAKVPGVGETMVKTIANEIYGLSATSALIPVQEGDYFESFFSGGAESAPVEMTSNVTSLGFGIEFVNNVRGALVYLNADLPVTPTTAPYSSASTPYKVEWNTAAAPGYDTDEIWSSGSPTRLTVPTGVTRVRLSYGVKWTGLTTAETGFVTILKNNAAATGLPKAVYTNADLSGAPFSGNSAIIAVTDGDYFELAVQNRQIAAASLLGTETWFSMEIIEANTKGAMIRLSAGVTQPTVASTPTDVVYRVPFDTKVYDDYGFWNSASPRLFTVPRGVRKIRLSYGLEWTAAAESAHRNIYTLRNSTFITDVTEPFSPFRNVVGQNGFSWVTAIGYEVGYHGVSDVINVVEGDIFDLASMNFGSTTANIVGGATANTWFAIEVVEMIEDERCFSTTLTRNSPAINDIIVLPASDNGIITRITVEVTEAFDGNIGVCRPDLAIGTTANNELLLTKAQTDLHKTGTMFFEPDYRYSTELDLNAYLTVPGQTIPETRVTYNINPINGGRYQMPDAFTNDSFNTPQSIIRGDFVDVYEGTVGAGTMWELQTQITDYSRNQYTGLYELRVDSLNWLEISNYRTKNYDTGIRLCPVRVSSADADIFPSPGVTLPVEYRRRATYNPANQTLFDGGSGQLCEARVAAGLSPITWPDLEIDGVALELGDRVLIKDHPDSAVNGIYVVTKLTDTVNVLPASESSSWIYGRFLYAATTKNLDATYSNGSSGVGATLTSNDTTYGPLIIDDATVPMLPINGNTSACVLIKNQLNPAHNGVYRLTQTNDAATNTPWILTRIEEFDTSTDMQSGKFCVNYWPQPTAGLSQTFTFVGTQNCGLSFYLKATVNTVGTDPVEFGVINGIMKRSGSEATVTLGGLPVNPLEYIIRGNQLIFPTEIVGLPNPTITDPTQKIVVNKNIVLGPFRSTFDLDIIKEDMDRSLADIDNIEVAVIETTNTIDRSTQKALVLRNTDGGRLILDLYTEARDTYHTYETQYVGNGSRNIFEVPSAYTNQALAVKVDGVLKLLKRYTSGSHLTNAKYATTGSLPNLVSRSNDPNIAYDVGFDSTFTTLTVDGAPPIVGDRILVKDQGTPNTSIITQSFGSPVQNGVYQVAKVLLAAYTPGTRMIGLLVTVATLGVLPGTVVYDNGTAGVGARLYDTHADRDMLIIDNVALNIGDIVLVKDQLAPAQNGAYVVTLQGNATFGVNWELTRHSDYDTGAELTSGYWQAVSGDANKGYAYMTTSSVTTVGTDAVTIGHINWILERVSDYDETDEITPGDYIDITDGAINASTEWEMVNQDFQVINISPLYWEKVVPEYIISGRNVSFTADLAPYRIETITIATAGTLYTNGTYECFLNGGVAVNVAKFSVTVSAGIVTDIFIEEVGLYNTKPSNPATITGLTTGSGATFTLTWADCPAAGSDVTIRIEPRLSNANIVRELFGEFQEDSIIPDQGAELNISVPAPSPNTTGSVTITICYKRLLNSLEIDGTDSGDIYYFWPLRNNLIPPPGGWTDGDPLWIDEFGRFIFDDGFVLDRGPVQQVDPSQIKNTLFYNSYTLRDEALLTYFDPVKRVLPGIALQELEYEIEFDPAIYTNGNDDEVTVKANAAWGINQLGRLWWDISTLIYLEYEQSDLEYRRKYWGRLFPGVTVDVYEWTRSTVAPSAYAEYVAAAARNKNIGSYKPTGEVRNPSDPAWVESMEFDPLSGQQKKFYYFWVKNVDMVPNVPFRSISARSVADILQDPTRAGISWFASTAKDAFILGNTQNLITDLSVLQINYLLDPDERPVHKQWLLVHEPEGSESYTSSRGLNHLDDRIWDKMRDSLVGYDALGNSVPDMNLDAVVRYGNKIRPRQSWFIDRLAARKILVQCVNRLFEHENVVDNVVDWDENLIIEDPEPSSGFQYTVSSRAARDALTSPPLIVGQKVLVTSDEQEDGKWTLWTYAGPNSWTLYSIQSYRTQDYWQTIDWYAEGYDSMSVIIGTYASIAARNAATGFTVGDLIAVTNDGADRWVWAIYGETNSVPFWTDVAHQLGTIELLDNLYDYDIDVVETDSAASIALKNILEGLREQILDDNQEGTVLFAMVKYCHVEQPILDWVFKTSYLHIEGAAEPLEQPPVAQPDRSQNLLDYVNEIKPYRTKVRTFIEKRNSTVETAVVESTETRTMDIYLKFDRVSCVSQYSGSETDYDIDNLTAADRIMLLYKPTVYMPAKNLNQLISGCEFRGAIYDGSVFYDSLLAYGYDASKYDNILGYDPSTGDFEDYYDVKLNGGALNSQPSVGDGEIVVDGNAFAQANISGGRPEELAFIRAGDALNIECYTVPLASALLGYDVEPFDDLYGYDLISSDGLDLVGGGSPMIVAKMFYGDGTSGPFGIGQTAASNEAVYVYKNGVLLVQSTDYSISIENRTITLVVASLTSDVFQVYSYNKGGEPVAKTRVFTDTSETVFEIGISVDDEDQVFVTVDGEIATFTATTTEVTIVSPVPSNSTVVITAFQDTTFSTSRKQSFTYAAGPQTFTMSYPASTTVPVHATTFVMLNGRRLNPAPTQYYVGDSVTDTFAIQSLPVSALNVSVWKAGVEQTQGVDYNVVGANVVFVGAPSVGEIVIIALFEGNDFSISGSTLTITALIVLAPGDKIVVGTFSDDITMGIRTEVYPGDASGVYTISQAPFNSDYMWVSLNGNRVLYNKDFSFNEDTLEVDFNVTTHIPSDSIIISTFAGRPQGPHVAFRMFKTIFGNWEFKRIADSMSCRLVAELTEDSTEIEVDDATVLGQPNLSKNIPGVVWIGTERIAFWDVDTAVPGQHKLRTLLRNTKGTGGQSITKEVGTTVRDASLEQVVPADINIWEETPYGLNQSESPFAKFLKQKPGTPDWF